MTRRWIAFLLFTLVIPLSVHADLGKDLLRAAEQGEVAEVRSLLQRGADVHGRDHSSWTPLIHAAYQGKNEVVRILLEAGADAKDKGLGGYTALSLAALKRGNKRTVVTSHINLSDFTPLNWTPHYFGFPVPEVPS